VVTFLFTDVEGSTRRWEADADGMRKALAAHDEVLREAIRAHGGWLFKHTGDGVCAAFASPRSAVDAAVAAQRGLELPVRMGLATGEAELREEDYFGTVLNRTARVMAAGHGGQILLADSTAGLLARLEAEHGDTVSAFDHLTLAIRSFHNAGDTTTLRVPLAVLAALFDRLGRYEPAATIAGFAVGPFSAAAAPEITTAIARKGETMTTAAMVTYAYDQIDQARTTLEHSG
jgi:class 3 adenylate cyclase